MKIIFFSVLFFFLAYTSPTEGIFHGKKTTKNQFPSLVRINSHFERTSGLCTGTIISTTCVLTAAHCVQLKGEPAHKIDIYMGAIVRNSPDERSVTIEDTYNNMRIHEEFNLTGLLENDIALMKTPLIQISESVQVAELPTVRPALERAGYLTAGWGGSTNWGEVPNYSQWTSYTLYSNMFCKYRARLTTFASHLCFYNGDSLSCPGDSGGPVYEGKIVHGVCANLPGSGCEVDNPVLFTNVFFFMGWIKETMDRFEKSKFF